MLDRDGNRIDRRNVQDIFTPLYDHQIPPGAVRVIHYRLVVPPTQKGPLKIRVRLQYRKFDARFLQLAQATNQPNTLPVTTMATDEVLFPVDGNDSLSANVGPKSPTVSAIPTWQRWNDYGIGLFLEGARPGERSELVGAVSAFDQVEKLGKADGPINLARVFIKQGRLADAAAAFARAADMTPAPLPWTLAWLNGLVHKQTGHFDKAIADFSSIVDQPEATAAARLRLQQGLRSAQ